MSETQLYVQIIKATARILLAILRLQKQRITRVELVKLMEEEGIDKNVTYNFIAQAEKDTRNFLRHTDWHEGAHRPTQVLGIEPNAFITDARTALLLMELARFQQGDTASKEGFIELLINKYQWEEADIEARMSFLKRIGEIGFGDDRTSAIWVDWTRYYSILPWLELLTKEKP
jgi:hypothetical protein